MSTQTQTLLPSARVDLFLRDKKTLEAARAIVDDWRFARVNVNVEEGDVETAIMSYQEADSASLVIIETDTTDDNFLERLGTLSAQCHEDTNAIVIGPVNDVDLYRQLTSMGVSDYLVRSVPLETLSEVIAKSLIDKLGTSDSRLIAVVGAKGGVGTTSITQALAWGLSEDLDQKTFLMDAAGGWSSLSIGMGFETTATLHEAAKAAENHDDDKLARMFFQANDKLTVLASGTEALLEKSVVSSHYEDLIDLMMKSYPAVLIDLSSTTSTLKRMVLSKAHEIVIVTTPTLASLRATRSLLQELKLLHGGDISNTDLVVNMAGMFPSKEVSKKDIIAALEFEPSVTLSFDPKLFISNESEGKKISSDKAGADVVASLLPMAQKVIAGTHVKEIVQNNNPINDFLGKIGLGPLKAKK